MQRCNSRMATKRLVSLLMVSVVGFGASIASSWSFAVLTTHRDTVSEFGVRIDGGIAWDWERRGNAGLSVVTLQSYRPTEEHTLPDGEMVPGVELPSWAEPTWGSSKEGTCLTAVASGWPFRAMACRWRYNCNCTGRWSLSRGIAIDSPNGLVRAVPLSFIWSGHIANIVLYALLCAGVVCGGLRVRRWVRLSQGRCPACGYPIGSGPVCSECGVRHRAAGRRSNVTR